jgi:ribosomal protein S18 acetylase RimI-like enzyme
MQDPCRSRDDDPSFVRPDRVRSYKAVDLPRLADIERTADRLFGPLGIVFPPGPTVIEEAVQAGADVYVVGDPPVGFAAVRERDGSTHLEQIAVHSDHGRRGIGGRLLGRVLEHAATRGSAAVTLITFRDVPWNGPWYARHGFSELPEERYSPQIRALWRAEIDAGLHALAPRLVMWAPPRSPD